MFKATTLCWEWLGSMLQACDKLMKFLILSCIFYLIDNRNQNLCGVSLKTSLVSCCFFFFLSDFVSLFCLLEACISFMFKVIPECFKLGGSANPRWVRVTMSKCYLLFQSKTDPRRSISLKLGQFMLQVLLIQKSHYVNAESWCFSLNTTNVNSVI